MSDRRRPSALEVSVAGLLGEAPGSVRDHEVADLRLDLGDDLRQGDPIEGHIRLARTNRGLLVTGRLRTSLLDECARCLAPIDVPIEIRIDEEALPSVDLHSGQPLDTTTEPDVARISDHHDIDLDPLIREAIQLAEPIAPVCRPDCPGLCPTCGRELAAGDHAHDDGPVDPRLEALRAFQVDGGDETG
ncbi:MAG: DUF177 domain-containing protein [Chloroflexota bacterium]